MLLLQHPCGPLLPLHACTHRQARATHTHARAGGDRQVIVIDEIGTAEECSAARTIAQRGVQLVATAHGNELENVIKNPSLSDLVRRKDVRGPEAGGCCCCTATP